MQDKLLYLTIGLLVGIVVMQWTSTPGPRAGDEQIVTAQRFILTAGRLASSGVYFYRLKAGTTTLTRKMVLLK